METHIYELKMTIRKITLNVKFPCSLVFQIKNQKEITEGKSIHQVSEGFCEPNQSFKIDLALPYNGSQYQDKNILVSGLMNSGNNKIPVGVSSFKIVENHKILTYNKEIINLPLKKCPDSSATIKVKAQLNFINIINTPDNKNSANHFKKLLHVDGPSRTESENSFHFKNPQKNFERSLVVPHRSSPPQSQKSPRYGTKNKQAKIIQNSISVKNHMIKTIKPSEFTETNVWPPHNNLYNSEANQHLRTNKHILQENQMEIRSSSRITQLQREKLQSQKQIAKLKIQLAEHKSKQKQAQLQRKFKIYIEEINSLSSELKKTKEQNAELSRNNRQSQQQLKNLEKHLSNLDNKAVIREQGNNKLLCLIQAKQQELISSKQCIRKLQQQLEDNKLQHDLSQKRRGHKQNSLQEQLHKFGEKYQKSEFQKQKMMIQMDRMLKNFEQSEKKNQAGLKQREAEFLDQKNKLIKSNQHLQLKLEKQQQQIQILVGQLTTNQETQLHKTAQNNQISALKQKLNDKQEELTKILRINASYKDNQQSRAQIEQLEKKKLSELQKQNKQLSQKLWSQKKSLMKMEKTFEYEKQENLSAFSKLSNELQQSKSLCSQIKIERDAKKQEIRQLSEKLKADQENYERTIKHHASTIKKLTLQQQELHQEFQQSKMLNRELKQEIQFQKHKSRNNFQQLHNKMIGSQEDFSTTIDQLKQKLFESQCKATQSEKREQQMKKKLVDLSHQQQQYKQLYQSEIKEAEQQKKKLLNKMKLEIEELKGCKEYNEQKIKMLKLQQQENSTHHDQSLRQMTEKLRVNKQTLYSAQSELQDLKRQLGRFETDKQFYIGYNKQLQAKIQQTESKLSSEIQDKQHIFQLKEQLQENLSSKDSQIMNMQTRLGNMQKMIAQKCEGSMKRWRQLQQKYGQIVTEQGLLLDMSPSSIISIENFLQVIQKWQQINRKLVKRYSQVQQQLNQQQQLHRKLVSGKSNAETKLKDLQEMHRKQLQNLINKYTQSQNQNSQLSQSVTYNQTQRTKLQRRINQSEQQNQELQSKITQLRQQISVLDNKGHQQQRQSQKNILVLNTNIGRLQQTITQKDKEIANLNQDLSSMQFKLKDKQGIILNNQRSISEYVEAISQQKSDIKQLNHLNQELRDKVDKYERQIREQRNENSQLINTIDNKVNENQNLRQQFHTSTKTINQLSQEMAVLRNNLMSTSEQLKSVKHQFQKQIIDEKKKVEEYENRYKQQQMKFHQLQNDKQELEDKYFMDANQKDMVIAQLKNKVELLERFKQSQQNKSSDYQQLINGLQANINILNQQLNELQLNNKSLQSNNVNLLGDLRTNQSKIQYLESIINQYTGDYKQLEQVLEQKQETLKNISTDLQQAHAMINSLQTKLNAQSNKLVQNYEQKICRLQSENIQELNRVQSIYKEQRDRLLQVIDEKDQLLNRNRDALKQKDRKTQMLMGSIENSLIKVNKNSENLSKVASQQKMLTKYSQFMSQIETKSRKLAEKSVVYLKKHPVQDISTSIGGCDQ